MLLRKIAKRVIKFSPLQNYQDFKRYCYEQSKQGVDTRIVQKYVTENSVKKLHIGCGPNFYEGWLNSDLEPRVDLDSRHQNTILIDATKPFPLPDNSFDYTFSEHIIEHITIEGGMNMLAESHRVLKKGGKIRIATPNLQFLVELHSPNKTPLQEEYIKWVTNNFDNLKSVRELGIYEDAFVINNFFRDFYHEVIYDFSALKRMLEHAGFGDVVQGTVGNSADVDLQNIEKHGQQIPPKFNILETLIVEATKK